MYRRLIGIKLIEHDRLRTLAPHLKQFLLTEESKNFKITLPSYFRHVKETFHEKTFESIIWDSVKPIPIYANDDLDHRLIQSLAIEEHLSYFLTLNIPTKQISARTKTRRSHY